MPDLCQAKTGEKMRGEEKCEPTEDSEEKGRKAMIKLKLQSNLMFEGKGKRNSNIPIHSVYHNAS